MSLFRLCEHEGRFDPDVYRALCHEWTWEEVGRIMTAVAVLGDERYDFNEWHKRNHDKIPKILARRRSAAEQRHRDGSGAVVVSLEDYMRELEENRAKLAEVEGYLQLHRSAIARGLGPDEGKLETDQADFFQEIAEITKGQITRIEAAIEARYSGEAARLDDD